MHSERPENIARANSGSGVAAVLASSDLSIAPMLPGKSVVRVLIACALPGHTNLGFKGGAVRCRYLRSSISARVLRAILISLDS